MTHQIFITGNSSGIGYELTRTYLQKDWEVFGLSRRGCVGLSGALHDQQCDLSQLDYIGSALEQLLAGRQNMDLVILNAGVLGEIRDLQDTSLVEIRQVMDINVWANKVIIDWLLQHSIQLQQLIMISSGAAVNGSRGWSAYSLSKASLNMLAKLYAAEMPGTHICALAPGLVDTAMQDHLCDPNKVDVEHFSSVQRIRDARGTDGMPSAQQAAEQIARVIPRLKQFDSGSFIDIRNL